MDKNKIFYEINQVIEESIETNNFKRLKNFNLSEILEFFNKLNDDKIEKIYDKLPVNFQREILEHSNIHLQSFLINILNQKNEKYIYKIIKKMDLDDIADILLDIYEEKRLKILTNFPRKKKNNLAALLKYPEDTAGGIMTKDYFFVYKNLKVKDVKNDLKKTENIHSLLYAYVVDRSMKLIGVLSLHDLLLAENSDSISDIMTSDVISVKAERDQEKVAELIEKYDFFALPVVNGRNKLIGMVTSDDIIDVIREEESEDIYKAIGIEEENLYTKNTFKVAKMRLPWLITTFFGSMLSASLLTLFKSTLHQVIVLTSFIPVITAMGGNIGTQTATIVVRGMAIGFINLEKIKKTLLRELKVAFLMSIVVAFIISTISYVWHGKIMLGVILGISMILGITTASLIGTVIPFMFKKLDIDPAIATGPFVTTTNDATGIIIYLTLAKLFITYLT
ncbi:MAG TPA: magnesium transporter [Candidatus Mcinerneyibacterium sp.]|nr:magnesium transporter [Candidatus Mcinerneyibacterium sp.]